MLQQHEASRFPLCSAPHRVALALFPGKICIVTTLLTENELFIQETQSSLIRQSQGFSDRCGELCGQNRTSSKAGTNAVFLPDSQKEKEVHGLCPSPAPPSAPSSAARHRPSTRVLTAIRASSCTPPEPAVLWNILSSDAITTSEICSASWC